MGVTRSLNRRVASCQRCRHDYLPTVKSARDSQTAKVPVFASVPTKLNRRQIASRIYIYDCLGQVGLEPRTVGGSDLGVLNPLHEVRTLARRCAGGIILGYRQVTASEARTRQWATDKTGEQRVKKKRIKPYTAPTPWNQLETGILFGLGLPLFVLKEDGIDGGIFDAGSSDVLVHSMPMPTPTWDSGDPAQAPWNHHVRVSFELALRQWRRDMLSGDDKSATQ